MYSEKNTARIVGLLFLIALFSSMLSGEFLVSLTAPDYLDAVSANEYQVFIGVLFLVILTASVVAIPIMMFPILKQYNETLALGYISARIFEGFSDFILAITPLLVLTLSREYINASAPVASYFQTTGAILLSINDWISVLENIPYCLGVIMFYYMVYRAQLLPRWLSIWGLFGAILFLVTVPFRMSGLLPQESVILAVPLVVNELVLAIWLIGKGFNNHNLIETPIN